MPTTTDHPPTDPDHLTRFLSVIHGRNRAQVDALFDVLERTVELIDMSAQQAVDRLPVGRLTGGVR